MGRVGVHSVGGVGVHFVGGVGVYSVGVVGVHLGANLSNRQGDEKLVMEWRRRLMEWKGGGGD